MIKNSYNDDFIAAVNKLKADSIVRFDGDIASKLDIEKGNFSLLMSGKRNVTYKVFQKLIAAYPELNSEEKFSKMKTSILSNSLKLIPYYDIDFYGGFEKVFADQKIHPAFFINNPIFYKAEFAVNLSGRSMSGVIPTNAVIGLREIRDWQVYFPSGEIYAIVTKNDMRTVKKIKWDKSRENLILIPEPAVQFKDDYAVEPLNKDFVTNFYEVVAWEQFGKLAM